MRPWRERLVDPVSFDIDDDGNVSPNTALEQIAYRNRNLPPPGVLELDAYDWYCVIGANMTCRQRGVVFRRYWMGRTTAEIAAEDGVRANTVQRTLNAGLAALRTHLRRYEGE